MTAATAIQADLNRHVVQPVRGVPPVSGHGHDAGAQDTLAQSMHLMGATISYSRNAEIYGESEAADYLYKVVSGTVRTYKVLNDGRRQIGGFFWRCPSAPPTATPSTCRCRVRISPTISA